MTDVDSGFFRTRSYQRENRGLEFDRTASFADAIYAIAMTLIVVGIGLPDIADTGDGGDLWRALDDQRTGTMMFFISFFIIGNYWIAHHRLIASMNQVNNAFLTLQLFYLALVAYLPFPAQLMGDYPDNPVAVSSFAIVMAAISALEVVLFVCAKRWGLFGEPITDDEVKYGVVGSSIPAVMLALSVPISFVSTTGAVVFWFVAIPIGVAYNRRVMNRKAG